jgi:hypothetical protein
MYGIFFRVLKELNFIVSLSLSDFNFENRSLNVLLLDVKLVAKIQKL